MGRHFLLAMSCFLSVRFAAAQGVPNFRWSLRGAYSFERAPTLLHAKALPIRDRQALLHLLEVELTTRDTPSEPLSAADLHRVAATTHVRLIDLNGDGKPEIIMSAGDSNAGCGAANFPFWIYTRTHGGFRKLWDSRGPDGIGGGLLLTVRRSRSHGYHDLVLASHDSAFSMNLSVQRYSHGKYEDVGCYNAELIDVRTQKTYARPLISPCSACRE